MTMSGLLCGAGVENMSVAANVMIDGSVSPSTSSGISSLCSSYVPGSNGNGCISNLTEAEALLQLSNQESDEGIVSDQSSASSTASSSSSSDLILQAENNKKNIKVRISGCEGRVFFSAAPVANN
jgi:hypothetical protein